MTSCADVGCDCVDPNGKFWRTKAEDALAELAAKDAEIAALSDLLTRARCVYCGYEVTKYPDQDTTDDALRDHVKSCPQHPYVQQKSRAEAAEQERDQLLRERCPHDYGLAKAALMREDGLIKERDEAESRAASYAAKADEARDAARIAATTNENLHDTIRSLHKERDTLRERVRQLEAEIDGECDKCNKWHEDQRAMRYRDRLDRYMCALTEEWDLRPNQMLGRVLRVMAEVDAHCAKLEKR